MLKSKYTKLFSCFVISILIVVALTCYANWKLSVANGFVRALPSHVSSPSNFKDLKLNSFYLAGIDGRVLYLGNYTAPNKYWVTDHDLRELKEVKMPWPDTVKVFPGASLVIDSPNIYLLDPNKALVLSGRLGTQKYSHQSKVYPFTAFSPTDKGSFVLRGVDNYNMNVLLKEDASPESRKFKKDILQKQIDGIFSTDGMLLKVPAAKKFVYVYYYRNQFLSFDEDLNLIYRKNTIDTNSIAKIKVERLETEKSVTMSAPPLIVNKLSCVSEKYLFVNSPLVANNESRKILDKASIIDVYELATGKYRLSFYLPDFGQKKVKDFRVFGNKLFAIYDHFVYSYNLKI